jgi:hypothetical protein
MRRNRWPNTPFWQQTETALRAAFGSSWRRGGECLFELKRGELRAYIDRKLDASEMTAIEDILAGALRKHAAETRAKAVAAARAAATFSDNIAYRRADYMESPLDRFLRQCVEWGIASETEAA